MYRKITAVIILSVGIFLQLLVTTVLADDVAKFQSVDLGIALQDFGYQEFNDQDVLLDREDGWIPGVTASYLLSSKKYFFETRISLHQGKVKYDGRTQGGAPLKTDTKEKTADVTLSLGIWDVLKLNQGSALYLGVGYREWQRDILPTSTVNGLFETYRWRYGFIGGAIELMKSNNISIWLDGRLTRPIKPTMRICYLNYDCTNLSLGIDVGGRVALPVHYELASNSILIVEPYFETWNFGRSSDKALTIDGVYDDCCISEPRSETLHVGINVTISRKF